MQRCIRSAVYTMPYMRGERGHGSEGSKENKAPESDWSPKAADCFQRLPRSQGDPRGPERLRAEGEQRGKEEPGEQGPWVWLKTQSCGRFPKAPKAPERSQGSRKAQEVRRGEGEQGGVRETRPLSLTEDPRLLKASKGSKGFLRPQGGSRGPKKLRSKGTKVPESDWRPKAAKGFWRLSRLPEAPGRSQGPQGCSEARGARPLSLTEHPRLLKASKGSQGFLRPQGGPRSSGKLRVWEEQGGARKEREARGTRPLSLTEDPRLLKAPKASWGPRNQGRLRGQGRKGSKGYVILGFRVSTTSVEARGEGQGEQGSKAYVILGFRVPTTFVGVRGEGAR